MDASRGLFPRTVDELMSIINAYLRQNGLVGEKFGWRYLAMDDNLRQLKKANDGTMSSGFRFQHHARVDAEANGRVIS